MSAPPPPYRLLVAGGSLLLSAVLVGCGGRRDPVADEPAAVDAWEALPDDFADFYERFHADSAFQLAHVTFPLAGRTAKDTATGEILEGRYEREDWALHRPLNLGDDFARDVEAIDEGLVFETIRARAGNYFLERRFAEMNGEWNLIYYRETMGGGE